MGKTAGTLSPRQGSDSKLHWYPLHSSLPGICKKKKKQKAVLLKKVLDEALNIIHFMNLIPKYSCWFFFLNTEGILAVFLS